MYDYSELKRRLKEEKKAKEKAEKLAAQQESQKDVKKGDKIKEEDIDPNVSLCVFRLKSL